MHVHGILKSSDKECTWIVCIIYKIPKKKARVVRTSILLYNTFIMSNIQCQGQNKAKINQMTPKIITMQASTESSACIW